MRMVQISWIQSEVQINATETEKPDFFILSRILCDRNLKCRKCSRWKNRRLGLLQCLGHVIIPVICYGHVNKNHVIDLQYKRLDLQFRTGSLKVRVRWHDLKIVCI